MARSSVQTASGHHGPNTQKLVFGKLDAERSTDILPNVSREGSGS